MVLFHFLIDNYGNGIFGDDFIFGFVSFICIWFWGWKSDNVCAVFFEI